MSRPILEGRGKLLCKLAKRLGQDNKKFPKRTDELELSSKRTKPNNIRNKFDDSSRPDYLNLFDEGKWDELQDHLKLSMRTDRRDICSRLFNKPKEEQGDVENKDKDFKKMLFVDETDPESLKCSEGLKRGDISLNIDELSKEKETLTVELVRLETEHGDVTSKDKDFKNMLFVDETDPESLKCSEELKGGDSSLEIDELSKEKETLTVELVRFETEHGDVTSKDKDFKKTIIVDETEPESLKCSEGLKGDTSLVVEQVSEETAENWSIFSVSPTGELVQIESEHGDVKNKDNGFKKMLFVDKQEPESLGCDYLRLDFSELEVNEKSPEDSASCHDFGHPQNKNADEGDLMSPWTDFPPFDMPDPDSHNIEIENVISTLDASNEEDLLSDTAQCHETSMPTKKRTWDRKNYCIFCKSLVTNFTRHLTRWHKYEKEVVEMLNVLDEDLKERKRKRQLITDSLRRQGNFLFNSSRKTDSDFLPTKRLPNTSKTKNKDSSLAYMTCRYCLGMFSRKTFYRHRKTCSVKQHTEKGVDLDSVGLGEYVFGSKPKQSVSKPDGITFMPQVLGASSMLKERILPLLQKDEFCSIALNDELILLIGSHFLANHLDQKHKYSCTQKMRDAAQLLKLCRSHPEINCLADCILPEHFYFVIEKVQELCGLEKLTGNVSKVGMPARLSYVLQEGAKIMLCKTITNPSMTKPVKDKIKNSIHEFLELIKIEWSRYVSTNAENTRKKNKCKKDALLPDDDDIIVVSRKIKELEEESFNSLKKDVNQQNYEQLCKITIAHMIVLNRRRANEVARAELEFYLNRTHQTTTPDVIEGFSPEEVEAFGMLEVFYVPGKNDNNAPILITEQMKKNINLLISCRKALGVDPKNPLLFARSFTKNCFDGCRVIRELRQLCILKKPQHFTSIGLRHHLATKTGIKGDDKYTDNVCQFLSHSKPVHLKNYRIPVQAIQRGRIGSHLLQMEGVTVLNKPSKITSNEITNQINKDLLINSPRVSENGQNQSESEFVCTSSDEEEDMPEVKRKKRSRISYRRWSEAEVTVVLSGIGHYVTNKKLPGRLVCSEIIVKNPVLAGRKWEQVNALIHNYSTGKTKLPVHFQFLRPT